MMVPLGPVDGGLREWQRAMADFAEGITRTNLHATREAFRLADPGRALEMQRRVEREYLDALAGNQVIFLRAARRAADEALPVGEGDRLVGMVTDRDVAVRLAAEGRDPAKTKVREVMTPEVRYVFEDEDLGRVAEDMSGQRVRRLPVANREKWLVGIVSLGDLAREGATGRESHAAVHAFQGVSHEGGPHDQTVGEPETARDRERA